MWIFGGLGLLSTVALVYFLPLILVPEAGLDDERRLKAENDLRTTFVQAIGGAIVVVGTARTLHINREGQITERFTRAIDQLGQTEKEALDVRLGGIYALERIARDSKSDRGPIVEVLTAFLREHTRWDSDSPDAPSVAPSAASGSPNEQRPPRLRADFQAVATILGRNGWSKQHAYDLRDVDLRGVNLSDARLEGANLSGAHLEVANLSGAHLMGANLDGAHLEGADLQRAHLEFSRGGDAEYGFKVTLLRGAHLEGADLSNAYLVAARLPGAHLERAHLDKAYLQQADLMGAHLRGASLIDANLAGALCVDADLRGAWLWRTYLGRANLTGADLTGAHLDGVVGLEHADLEGVIGIDADWKRTTLGNGETTAGEETPAVSDDEVD